MIKTLKRKINILHIFLFLLIILGFASVAMAFNASVDYGGEHYDVAANGTVTHQGTVIGSLASDGTFTDTQGNTGNVFGLNGAKIEVSLDNGYTVGTRVDGHSVFYQSRMFAAGVNYANAVSNNDQQGMQNAIAEANTALEIDSQGGQTEITIHQADDNTVYYGCVNDQPFYLTVPGEESSYPVEVNGANKSPYPVETNGANKSPYSVGTNGAGGIENSGGNGGNRFVGGGSGGGGNSGGGGPAPAPAPVCADTCQSLGYQCGEQTICGKNINCGQCSFREKCAQGKCVHNPIKWRETIPE